MSENLRYEQKMLFDALRLAEVRSWVFGHPDSFRVAYPPRQVNNIYFDTIERTFLSDHLSGTDIRSKVRFRWYGETWTASNGQIEIKKKNGQLGTKIIQPIETNLQIEKTSWKTTLQSLRLACSPEMWALLSDLIPVIINQYRREYFVSIDGVVRVTLDYEMRVYDQSFGFYPNTHYRQQVRNDVIIEMKAGKQEHQRIANALAGFPLRCVQNSKYLNGLEFLV